MGRGDYYRKLSKDRTVQRFIIPANRNIYSADGSLYASIQLHHPRFDANTKLKISRKNVAPLSDALSKLLGKPSSFTNRFSQSTVKQKPIHIGCRRFKLYRGMP
jgi:hypothetical protein